MEIIVLPSENHVGHYAALLMARAIEESPQAVLGVATGSSPLSTYQHLSQLVQQGLDVSQVKAFALDEYVEIKPGHPESYRSVIDREVVQTVGLQPHNVHVLNGQADDLPLECALYEEKIRHAGGVDVQLLGIGSNGHIGFNEPGSSLASRTRIKTLAPKTRADNARFFDDDMSQVPIHCLTQGIGTILEARRIVLVALGAGKAAAVARMAEGPLGTHCPASALQMHEHVSVIVDEAAAQELQNLDYYRYAQENLPLWQQVLDK